MKLIAIVDSVGRVILGRHNESNSSDDKTCLQNPAVVNIQVNQESGQISVQLIPYIFREFVAASKREEGVSWLFNNNGITTSPDLVLEESIVGQYSKIFESSPEVEDAKIDESNSGSVQLFDDEDDTAGEDE